MSSASRESRVEPTNTVGFSASPDLEELRRRLAAFAEERDWDQFHLPRSLALALVGEVGELAECFQWKSEAAAAPGLPGWSEADKEHLGEELADVLMYLIRLSDKCGIDLVDSAERKMARNAQKYPADKCRGSARKYTAYEQSDTPGQ